LPIRVDDRLIPAEPKAAGAFARINLFSGAQICPEPIRNPMGTSGAAFSGLELITTLLADLGFTKEERQVRKLMVLPPSHQFQRLSSD
jgi:hypothetical protein